MPSRGALRRLGSPAVLVALAVLAVAGTALTLTRRQPDTPLPGHVAIRDALHGPGVRQALAGTHWSHASASALDGRLERVSFFAGDRTVAEVAVSASGATGQIQVFGAAAPFGNWIGYEPGLLIALSALFVLMLAVAPLSRLRNLDVIAALSLTTTVPLFQHGFLKYSVIAILPGLGWLMARCLRHGLGTGDRRALRDELPLFDWITRRWASEQRVRALRIVALVLGAVLVMVAVGTPSALDIPYAVMEGATVMLHGLLPYGHMPGDVIHGDTYPILSYALYAPLAWLAPVHSTWDSIYAALALCALAAVATAGGMLRAAGGARPRRKPRATLDEARGLRTAVAWLSFPPMMIIASTGTTDVVLAAMLVFALVLWRAPAASTALLALAGCFKLAPFALIGVWLAPRRGGELRRALVAATAVVGASVGLVVVLGGPGGPAAMAHAVSYQFGRGSLQSLWVALGIKGLQPIGEAVALALLAGTATQLWRRPELAVRPDRIAALCGATLISLQLVANYWSVLYLAWVMPLCGLSLFCDGAVPETSPVMRRSAARVIKQRRDVAKPQALLGRSTP